MKTFRKKIFLIAVLSLLVFQSKPANSDFFQLNLHKISNLETIESFPENLIEDYRIVSNELNIDINKNKIHDRFEEKVSFLDNCEKLDIFIAYDSKITEEDVQSLEVNNIEVIKQYSVVHGLHARCTKKQLEMITELASVKLIESNLQSTSLMYSSTNQIKAREVWQPHGNYGFTGNPNTSIAILDTGIDSSHLDSSFDIVYWKDYAGRNVDYPGDEYAEPSDFGEHGTHVASIAASKGVNTLTNQIKVVDTGFYPNITGYARYGTWFYVDFPQTITIKVIWDDDSYCIPFAGIINVHNNLIWDNIDIALDFWDSPFVGSTMITTPGWYCPIYGSWDNQFEVNTCEYSAEISHYTDWEADVNDTFAPFTGVAPSSKIVGLKILDDDGYGTSLILLNALDWLYVFGQDYNVTVVNMSIGFGEKVSYIDSAITSLVRNKGIVCVSSAGNSGTSSGGMFSPASSPDCIAVGAVNKADEIAYYSSIGDPSSAILRPDVVAPGGSFAWENSSAIHSPIFAADSNDVDIPINYNYNPPREMLMQDSYANNFVGMQGTSMASPFVAGLAQLVIDALIQRGDWSYSWESAKKVKQIICMGTFEVGNIKDSMYNGGEPANYDGDDIPQTPTIDRTEKDITEGWGRISVTAAIQSITHWISLNSTESFFFDGSSLGNQVEIRQVELIEGEVYYVRGELNGTPVIDADILVFDKHPTDSGDPSLLAYSTRDQGSIEELSFIAPENGTYYIVTRWVGGGYEGYCNLTIIPLGSISLYEDSFVYKSGTQITFDIDGQYWSSLSYNWDSSTNQSWSEPYIITIPIGDGEHQVNIYAESYLGLECKCDFRFITDDSSPEVILINPNELDIINSQRDIEVSVEDPHLLWVKFNWDNKVNSTVLDTYVFHIPETDGLHVLNIYAQDIAENDIHTSYVFEADNIPPDITLTSPENFTIYTKKITLKFDIFDENLDEVKYKLNVSSNYVTFSEPYEIKILRDQGIYLFTVLAWDKAGNSASAKYIFSREKNLNIVIIPSTIGGILFLGSGTFLSVYLIRRKRSK